MLRRSASACFVLAIALTFAGCGGGASSSSTPSPSASSTLTPTPTANVAVGGNATEKVDGEKALQHVIALAKDIGPRPAGQPGELQAAEYIEGQLQSFGYKAELQEFTFQQREDVVNLSLITPQGRSFSSGALDDSGEGEVTETVVAAGIGLPEDFPSDGVHGGIALVERGQITFSNKVTNALNAGAKAVIVYNNQPGTFGGALSSRVNIPVVGLSREDGQELLRLVNAGSVTATVSARIEETTATSRNVIGHPAGSPCEIIVGGHYDSVPVAPGGNDNASGTATLLEMARVAAIRGQATNVCFMAFGGEELGLLGSMHYVTSLSQEEKQRIRAMINLDVVGAGNGWTLIGSQQLVETAQEGADTLGYRASPGNLPAGSSSDHASFIGAGIPAVFITVSGSPPIHTPNDTADTIRPELLGQAAEIGMYVLGQLRAPG